MDSVPTAPDLETRPGRARALPGVLGPFRVTIAVLWSLVIAVLCWLPRAVVHNLEKKSSWFEIHNFDKLVHAGIFVVFGVLWFRTSVSSRRRLWIALGSAGLALVTELVQDLPIVGRDATIADGLADVAGALIGIALAPALEPLIARVESWIFAKTFASSLDSGERSRMYSEGVDGPVG